MNTKNISTEELREWSAVSVMGWRYEPQIKRFRKERSAAWVNSSGQPTCFDWKPDTDLNQLRQVVKAFCGDTIQGWFLIAEELAKLHITKGELVEFCLTDPELILKTVWRVWKIKEASKS
jgi:hypothetical protein